MKKIITLFLGLMFVLSSCEGPVGPPGPPGAPGSDGTNGILGQVFEVEAYFTSGNDYQYLVQIPQSIEVYESDVVMAYILVGVDDGIDIWEPLPQTLFLGKEILLYGFDHTLFDVNLFLDGNVYLPGLDPSYTDEVVFRIAVIPADFAAQIDVNKLDHVMKALNVQKVSKLK